MSWAAAFTGCIVVMVGWALWISRGFGPRAGLFPWAIGIPVLALAMIQLVLDLHGQQKGGGTSTDAGEGAAGPPTHVISRRTAGIAGWTIGFLLAIWALGITMAVPVTTLLYLKAGAGERWSISLLFTAGLWLLIYGLFIYTLQIPFPEGWLWDWVG